jgi:hypothetical protein
MGSVGTGRTPSQLGRWLGIIRLPHLTCLGALLLVAIPSNAPAQMNTGTVLGSVTDPTGAAVADAEVTVTDVSTSISKKTTTDSAGNYVVPYLVSGFYEISAQKEGFKKTTRTGITIQVDQKARVDLPLQLGAVTDRIEVTGEATLVKTESSEQGQVINSQQMVGLPLNVRDFAQFVSLNTGSVPNPGSLGGNINPDNPQGISDTNVNGIETDANNWQIDGMTNNEAFFSILSVSPSVDAIQEFKVANNNYSAEFGRAGGANVQIQTKSGTNQFHGVLFEFLRNSALDANDYFSNSSGVGLPPFRQNQFGGNLGGPIIRDRTFFFADYEGYRSRLGQTELQTVPTALQRQGIFTESGNPTIYNQLTQQLQPFPNNTIPANLISPVSANVMALLPLPNITAPIGQANHAAQNSLAHDTDTFDVRVDHRVSDKDQVFTRYSFLRTVLSNPPFLGTVVGGDPFLAALANTRNQNGVVSEIHSFSPRTINEFRFGVNRVRTNWTAFDVNSKTSDEVGIPGVNDFCGFCGGLARISIAGMSAYGHTDYAPTYRHDTIFQWVDNVTFVRGKNTIKAGVDIRRIQADLFQTTNPVGEFDFDQRFSSGPDGAGGLGLATFLLGYPETISRAAIETYPSGRTSQLFGFAQDDIRVTKNLTLNVGLRWEYYSPVIDAHSRQSNFDLATGDVLLACIATTCAAGVKPDLDDWAPRFGFAYSPDKGKTAIRGGTGISYFSPGYGGQLGFLNDNWPFIQGQTISPANPLVLTPNDPTLAEGIPPLPPVVNRPGAPIGYLVPGGLIPGGTPQGTGWTPSDLRMTRVYQWSLDIQRAITPNFLIDAAYVGNAVNHLFIGPYFNYPQPGVVTANPNLTLQQLRPYYSVDPNLATVGTELNTGRSHYNSLQVKIEKRLSHGLTFLTSYTWSKVLDRGSQFNNPADYLASQQPAGFDTPQRLTVSYIYEFPFGRRRQFGSSWNRWTDGALGGWSASGIVTYMTGFPFTPSIASNLDNGNSDNPNRVCNGQISKWTIANYYDTSCFVSPAFNVFGNSGFGILRGPGFRDWDVSMRKDFSLGPESRYLQFRAEFFNLANNVNFAIPNSAQCGGACGEGTITSVAAGSNPRQIQFALKLYF